jgi:putative spermidine/putrescine transport system substrate-binding protein
MRLMHRRRFAAAVLAVGALALTACSVSSSAGSSRSTLNAADWASVLAQAKGQTVNWYMYGGDDTLNTFVTGYVAHQLKSYGVTLNEVKITDTADAINTVLGEKQAGKGTGGSVDTIWVNGENFATGVQAGLWSCGWPKDLPNAKYVDFTNPAVANDFGLAVNGCEAVWQQADSALVYDSAKLSAADVASVASLFAWAKAHPGHVTYPALPDFTGSMAVRTILYDTLGGPSSLSGPYDQAKYAPVAAKLWPRLNAIKPALWRGGSTYPQTQDQVEKLYSDGEISAYFTYGPGAVGDQVKKGLYPATTREAVPSVGNIANYSFLGIPANAAHRAAALVLANVLQDRQTQLALYQAEGIYPGIDLAKTDAATRAQFAAVPVSPSVLPLAELTRHAQPELAGGYVTRIEKDWKIHVQQR